MFHFQTIIPSQHSPLYHSLKYPQQIKQRPKSKNAVLQRKETFIIQTGGPSKTSKHWKVGFPSTKNLLPFLIGLTSMNASLHQESPRYFLFAFCPLRRCRIRRTCATAPVPKKPSRSKAVAMGTGNVAGILVAGVTVRKRSRPAHGGVRERGSWLGKKSVRAVTLVDWIGLGCIFWKITKETHLKKDECFCAVLVFPEKNFQMPSFKQTPSTSKINSWLMLGDFIKVLSSLSYESGVHQLRER